MVWYGSSWGKTKRDWEGKFFSQLALRYQEDVAIYVTVACGAIEWKVHDEYSRIEDASRKPNDTSSHRP